MPVATCRSCVPLTCPDQSVFDYYTIDGPSFNFVLNCPPGFDCEKADFFQMDCCGDLYGAYLYGPEEQRQQTRTAIVERCIQRRMFCGGGDGRDPDFPPPTFYRNRPQSAAVICPDGSFFTYWVPAGIFAAPTQSLADTQALALARDLVVKHKICLSSTIPSEFCAHSSFNASITASGGGVLPHGNIWSVISGAVPPGLTFATSTDPVITLNGVPTTGGTYTFTVQFLTTNNDYQRKTITICIVDITPASATLTPGTTGTSYSATFAATSCAITPYGYQISSGTLPPGLHLNESTGVLSGTPTTNGAYNFTVHFQDHAT